VAGGFSYYLQKMDYNMNLPYFCQQIQSNTDQSKRRVWSESGTVPRNVWVFGKIYAGFLSGQFKGEAQQSEVYFQNINRDGIFQSRH